MSHFRWNAGGWFGGQMGATIWLLLLGLLVVFRDPLAGWVAIGCATLANLAGVSLWMSRSRLEAYTGIQVMMGVTFILALTAVVIYNQRALPDLPVPGLGTPARIPLWILFTYPGVMVQLMLLERAARRRDG